MTLTIPWFAFPAALVALGLILFWWNLSKTRDYDSFHPMAAFAWLFVCGAFALGIILGHHFR